MSKKGQQKTKLPTTNKIEEAVVEDELLNQSESNENEVDNVEFNANDKVIVDVEGRKEVLNNDGYYLRPNRKPNYDHLFTQLGYKVGLREFGDEGVIAIEKEVKQLYDYECVTPRSDLTKGQRQEILEYLIKLKRKKDGTIKGRGCVDRSRQTLY